MIPSLAARLPAPTSWVLDLARRHTSAVMFTGGFLFDLATIRRIDAWTDLSLQLLYLVGVTTLLLYQHRASLGRWAPPVILERVWAYNVEVLHFFYGALLSAYVVLYLRSSTRARPLVFLILLVALMFVNEMPRVRRAGYRLRLGLYAFCVISFLNYFVPIVLGRMGDWVFALTLAVAAGVTWLVADRLATREVDRRATRARLYSPALAVAVALAVLYALRLIPPVPLSVQSQGIYHDVRREAASYVLTYEKPPLYLFWRRDSRPFRKQPGDRLHYFLEVFAPARFRQQVYARWEHRDAAGDWRPRDRIRLSIVGGRAEGFRSYAVKSNFEPGQWRVITETADGRAMASLAFTVEEIAGETEREWRRVGG
ncbi:MAG TPA: DUF2914 domain-containing protein [Candidatus Polarisedimenticolaceae bacterium]|nr:DUF2914 domain-containing protein [Candidatus Polarisedimenticolaceae bacterium]